MSVTYSKLWKLLIDKKMTKTDLRHQINIGTSTLAKMGKDQVVSMDIILKICQVLDCDISDIMDVVKEEGITNEK